MDSLRLSNSDLYADLLKLRGDESAEFFVFRQIVPYIKEHGEPALEAFDATLAQMCSSTRYHYVCMLGHIDHEPTYNRRIQYLQCYAASEDIYIAEGAKEAFEYLELP